MPEFERVIKLALLTGVGTEWLFTGRGPMGYNHRSSAGTQEPAADDYLAMAFASDDLRLIGVIRSLSAEKRQALGVLLDVK